MERAQGPDDLVYGAHRAHRYKHSRAQGKKRKTTARQIGEGGSPSRATPERRHKVRHVISIHCEQRRKGRARIVAVADSRLAI